CASPQMQPDHQIPSCLNWNRTCHRQTHRDTLDSPKDTMDLVGELQALIFSYLRGELTARDLDRNLAAYVRPIAAGRENAEARRLYGRTRTLLSELGYGHRDESSVQSELQSLMWHVVVQTQTFVPVVALSFASSLPQFSTRPPSAVAPA